MSKCKDLLEKIIKISDTAFETLIHAIAKDAIENPSKVKDLKEVWDSEWDELLDGVPLEDDE